MIRFAIAGTGRISDWVLKGALEDPRFTVTAVCSRSEESAKNFIAAHPEALPLRSTPTGTGPEAITAETAAPHIFTDITECAKCPDVDAVYVGTPSSTHHRYAMACLKAGKHVLCEKPIACNARELEEMIAEARRNNVLLMEAMVSTLNPNFRAAAEVIKGTTAEDNGKGPQGTASSDGTHATAGTDGTQNAASSDGTHATAGSDGTHATAGTDETQATADTTAPGSPSGLGTIHHYFSSYCQYSTKYDALLKGNVSNSFDPRMGGGALEDLGIYTIYPLVALFGEPNAVSGKLKFLNVKVGEGLTPDAAAEGHGGEGLTPDAAAEGHGAEGPALLRVDTEGTATLKYGTMTASLSWSKAVDAHQPTEICGEKGNVILDEVHICHRAGFIPHLPPSGGRGPKPAPVILSEDPRAQESSEAPKNHGDNTGLQAPQPHDTYYYEIKEFIDVLEDGRRESDINTLETSLKCRRIMDALHRME